MRVYIPTTAVAERWHTHKLFPKKVAIYPLCHTEADLEKLPEDVVNRAESLLVTGATNYIDQLEAIEHTARMGQWYLKADDNIRCFMGSDGNILSAERAWEIIENAIIEADRRGARLVGFAPVDNPFFRKTVYRDVGFCVGKMYAEKRTEGINCTGRIRVMDDYERTAQHLYKFGRVLVCNSLHSKSKHYELGGIGSWENRLPQKLQDCRQLMKEWPALFRYKAKASKDPHSEVQLRFTSVLQVEQWRLFIRRHTMGLGLPEIELSEKGA